MFEIIWFSLVGLAISSGVGMFCYFWWCDRHYQYFSHETMIYNTETKKIVEIIKKHTNLPKSHSFLQKPNRCLTLIEKEARIDIAIKFVTSDQVIRNFWCMIDLRIKEADLQGLQKVLNFINSNGEISIGKSCFDEYDFFGREEVIWQLPVQRMMHDFHNVYLSQIKELNNPSDDKQQRIFCDLAQEYFDHRLSESDSNIEIKSCRFSLS
jgi:hypothetical protein